MADVQRTLAQMLTLFADSQGTGAITPQDVRDMIVSLAQVPYGGIHTLSSIETTVDTQSVFVKGACTTQSSNLRNFDMPTDNRLRYIGLIPYHFHIACSLSMITAGSNNLTSFKLYKYDDSAESGALIDGSQVNRHMSIGADEGSTALHWDTILDTNDYLEIHLANLTNTGNITLTNFYLFAVGMVVG